MAPKCRDRRRPLERVCYKGGVRIVTRSGSYQRKTARQRFVGSRMPHAGGSDGATHARTASFVLTLPPASDRWR
jgi:hypothetical protein